MNRQIKFRIWNTHKRVWLDSSSFAVDGNGFLLNVNLGRHECVVNSNYNASQDTYVIQYNTGLKDKNGKEIYEGDIIRYGSTVQYYESVVSYRPPYFIGKNFFYKYDNDVIWGKKGLEAFNQGLYRADMNFTNFNYIEVIGNLFENEDLLNERN